MVVHRLFSLGFIAGLLLLTGCATAPKPVTESIFYPPRPAEPRLQYLTSFTNPRDIEIPDSAFKKFLLGEDSTPKNEIVKPYGLAIQGSQLFVCDSISAQIHILDLKERTWEYFHPKNAGKLEKPINIAVDDQQFRYVADPVRGAVLVYNSKGIFETAIGKEQSMKPVGVAVSEDRVYIADLQHSKVHVFEKATRKLLFSIPRKTAGKQEQLFSPTNITLGPQGEVYVSDTGAFRVQQYDRDGAYIRTFGHHGDSAGEFARNKGLAVDRLGNLYVVDAAIQAIQIFGPNGDLLLFFGEPGASPAALTLPADVIIDYENAAAFQHYADENFELEYLVFVSNQYGPRKVAVYGFGQMKKQ